MLAGSGVGCRVTFSDVRFWQTKLLSFKQKGCPTVPNSNPNIIPSGTPSPPENVHEVGVDRSGTLNCFPGRMKQPSRPENGVSTVTTRDVSVVPVSFVNSTMQPIFNSAEVIIKGCVGDSRVAEPQLPVPPPPISGSSASALVVLAESMISVNKTNK